MRVTIVGTGYVGLVTGTCLADFGHHVACIDINTDKIHALNQGKVPIYEPNLEELIKKNIAENRLVFSTNLTEHVQASEIVFIAVGTPQNESTGQADLAAVMKCAQDIVAMATSDLVLVTKSTVPIDTHLKLEEIACRHAPSHQIDIVSNPEFLREGSAIEDFMNPDRVVIGTFSHRAKSLMQSLYQPLSNKGIPLIFTSPASAELSKYASNCFLATKIAFINELANLCEKSGAEIDQVAYAMGLDKRIGLDFLKTGPGYGGSCFPKDTQALAYSARQMNAPLSIVESVIKSNDKRKQDMAQRIKAYTTDFHSKTLALLGVAFKAGTDDIRESPALPIIQYLYDAGYTLRVYDPEAIPNAKSHFSGLSITWCASAKEALSGSDAALIITEWQEFKSLDPSTIASLLKTPLLIDLRNIIDADKATECGLFYVPLGKAAPHLSKKHSVGSHA